MAQQDEPQALPGPEDVADAAARIAPHTRRTPVLTSRQFDAMAGAELFFKCENFQRTGAFKARGAANAVFSLYAAQAACGVATHSSGNHGMALAWAAGRRGIGCTVVMPEAAPRAKRDAVAGYGARIVGCASGGAAREAALAGILAGTGAEFVHPYADARVIAGQATAARELLHEVAGLDTLIAPVGGGGLLSGCCLAVAAAAAQGGSAGPVPEVLGAEPAAADDAARSLRAGRLIADDAPLTVADGLRMPLKPLTFAILRAGAAGILTVEEDAIVAAMRLIWERMKIVVEPSGAVPFAAILARPERFRGRRVGVILSGGNVDLGRLPWQPA